MHFVKVDFGLSHQLKKGTPVSVPVTCRDVNWSTRIHQVDRCFMFNVRLVDLGVYLVWIGGLGLGPRAQPPFIKFFSGFTGDPRCCLFPRRGVVFSCFGGSGIMCDRLLLPATSSRRGYSPSPRIFGSWLSWGRCGTPIPCTALTPPLAPLSSPKARCSESWHACWNGVCACACLCALFDGHGAPRKDSQILCLQRYRTEGFQYGSFDVGGLPFFLPAAKAPRFFGSRRRTGSFSFFRAANAWIPLQASHPRCTKQPYGVNALGIYLHSTTHTFLCMNCVWKGHPTVLV